MAPLPTVLLYHDHPRRPHLDWLMVDPHDRSGLLWAARAEPASYPWQAGDVWWLEPLPPHRRRYLQWEGELSDGRGWVRRMDEGGFVPRVWCDGRIDVDLRMERVEGRVSISRCGDRWRAGLEPA